MADNWAFVAAAYAIAAAALGGYWSHLLRRERALASRTSRARARRPGGPRATSTAEAAGR